MDLCYFGSIIFMLMGSIHLLSVRTDYYFRYYSLRSPEFYILCGFVGFAYFTYLWIWTRKEYLLVAEDYIEKKTRKGLKKAHWNEIQEVRLFEKAKIEVSGKLQEVKFGPSFGIILKEQYEKINPWEPKHHDIAEYYITVSEDYYAEVNVQRLYVTVMSQINKYNGDGIPDVAPSHT